MAHELFIEKNFRRKALDWIEKANKIIDEYERLGLRLTLRQLYYQFVSRNWLKNTPQSYDNLGVVVSDARLAGMIDWDAIEDRTRALRGINTYNSPRELITEADQRYYIDMWYGQQTRVEVWVEKEALIGVFARPCNKWQVDYFACKGYASQSELYAAGKRIEERRSIEGQDTVVLHFGDHDPSGLDMTRDNCDRLSLFAGQYVEVKRLALNFDQVKQYNPPPNPAKQTDCRFAAYAMDYGNDSWELDALEPTVLQRLVEDNIKPFIDPNVWAERKAKYDKDKKTLKGIISRLPNE